MTLLVPFDGSTLSKRALERADEFAALRNEEVVVMTVVPEDESFAVDRGWIEPGESLDVDAVCDRFEAVVHDIDASATFRCERPSETEALATTTIDDITRTIRTVADELDVSIVFIGSENAGIVSLSSDSVGDPISEDPRYDVHIVRNPD
jgi:nucleotide-binding universal stress UspA family protein